MPLAYWISRLCEEFPAYGPLEAYRAWLLAPPGWIEEVIEARAYAKARAMHLAADTKDKRKALPRDSRLLDLAIEFDFEKAQQRG